MIVYDFNDKLSRNNADASSNSPKCSVLSNKLNTVHKVRSAMKKKNSTLRQKLLNRRIESTSCDQENNHSVQKTSHKRKVHFAPMAKVVLVRKLCKEDGKHIWYNWTDYRSFEHERRKAVAFFQDAIDNKRSIDPKQDTIAGLEKYLNIRLMSEPTEVKKGQHIKRSYSAIVHADSKKDLDKDETMIRKSSETPNFQFQHKPFMQHEQPYYYNYCYHYWYNPSYTSPGYYMPECHYNPAIYHKQYEFVTTPCIPVTDFDKNKSVCITPVS